MIEKSTQGALRDPGLWCTTPSGNAVTDGFVRSCAVLKTQAYDLKVPGKFEAHHILPDRSRPCAGVW
jgi:hypothetical protein